MLNTGAGFAGHLEVQGPIEPVGRFGQRLVSKIIPNLGQPLGIIHFYRCQPEHLPRMIQIRLTLNHRVEQWDCLIVIAKLELAFGKGQLKLRGILWRSLKRLLQQPHGLERLFD